MVCFATSQITSNSGNNFITLKIQSNKKAIIRDISVVECPGSASILMPWQYFDLLSQMLPKYVHSYENHVDVHLEESTPIQRLVVTHKNGGKKYYKLNHYVSTDWMLSINPAHLCAMVYWWRCNRHLYNKPTFEWGIWKNEG